MQNDQTEGRIGLGMKLIVIPNECNTQPLAKIHCLVLADMVSRLVGLIAFHSAITTHLYLQIWCSVSIDVVNDSTLGLCVLCASNGSGMFGGKTSLVGQLYLSDVWGEKYIWTLKTAFHARHRNVGGSSLISLFRTSI